MSELGRAGMTLSDRGEEPTHGASTTADELPSRAGVTVSRGARGLGPSKLAVAHG